MRIGVMTSSTYFALSKHDKAHILTLVMYGESIYDPGLQASDVEVN